MNDQAGKSGVTSTSIISVFILGLVLGLFIGIFGGPLIERYFGSDSGHANTKVVPSGPKPPREGEEAPKLAPTENKTPEVKPSEVKPTDPKPADSAKPTPPAH
ncbi:MAG: hypothetical protein ACREJO_00725 [Phycisphaerales bacterium]